MQMCGSVHENKGKLKFNRKKVDYTISQENTSDSWGNHSKLLHNYKYVYCKRHVGDTDPIKYEDIHETSWFNMCLHTPSSH